MQEKINEKTNIKIEDIKKASALLNYNSKGQFQTPSDEDISKLIEDIENQTLLWLKSNGIVFDNNNPINYNTKRLIILECVINLAISYNSTAGSDYIKKISEERDYYRDQLKENLPRFTNKNKSSSPPRLKNGNVFH